MPYRLVPLVTDQYYHVFNRGVEKRSLFLDRRGYKRLLETLIYYQQINPPSKFSLSHKRTTNVSKMVEVVSYCLMPNHFHLLLKQVTENGISTFLRKSLNSYTKYFNIKYERVGPLFQGQFKAVRIETDEQLIHVSRYIHLNPVVGHLVKNLRSYEWSSYAEYLGEKNGICDKREVLNFFKRGKDYEQFVLDQVDYANKLEESKHLLLDLG